MASKLIRANTEYELLRTISNPNIQIPSCIGIGSFQRTKSLTDILTKQKIAHKIIDFVNDKVIKTPPSSEERLFDSLESTPEVLKKISNGHPGIIPIVDIIKCEGCGADQIIMENGGMTLRKYMQKNDLTDQEIFSIAEQIFSALLYLHENDVIHRDIKPENIVVDEAGRVRIIDFGSATQSTQSKEHTKCRGCTVGYCHPDSINTGKKHDSRIDLWSWAIVVFELYMGVNPFLAGFVRPENLNDSFQQIGLKAQEMEHYFDKAATGCIPENLLKDLEKRNPNAHDLIVKLLNPKIKKMPSHYEVEKHPYFCQI